MKKLLTVIALAALLTGCATVPFTQEMRDKYGLTPEHIQRVQFYNSDEIVLERHVQRQKGEPTPESRLQLTQTDIIRTFVIPQGTPGVAIGVTNDMLEISFEDGKSLFFGSSPAKRKQKGGTYCLLARDWTDRRGTLTYGDEIYRTAFGNGEVRLLVNVDDIHRFREVRKTLKGVTVADHQSTSNSTTLTGRRVSETDGSSVAAPEANATEMESK